MPVQLRAVETKLLFERHDPVIVSKKFEANLMSGDSLHVTTLFECNGVDVIGDEPYIASLGLDALWKTKHRFDRIMKEYKLISDSSHKRFPSELRRVLDSYIE